MGTNGRGYPTPDELVRQLQALPASTTFTRDGVVELLAGLREHPDAAPPAPSGEAPGTWRERLWTCPPETRLGVVEIAEALGRPKSFVYRLTTARSAGDRLPCRRLGGYLVFVAGEVRAWVRKQEDVLVAGDSPVRRAP